MDSRRAALCEWAARVLGDAQDWRPAAADASFRRYFRAVYGPPDAPRGVIAMDAPPERENNAAFVHVAGLMRAAGLHVPRIIARDMARGFLLLDDLGTQTYLDVLDADNANALFTAAIDALVAWQAASRPGVLPDYDRATLHAELELFRDWYLARHLRYTPGAAEHADIDAAFDYLLDSACAQGQVYVHRDYMPRNLMISEPLPGVLDFQDARFGPVTYDVASLFKDASISWPEPRVQGWQHQYWTAARAADLPVAQDPTVFARDAALMGAQRHLKVLGIFARIAHRDGKPRYLTDTPRFVDYLRPVVREHAALAPLAPLLELTP